MASKNQIKVKGQLELDVILAAKKLDAQIQGLLKKINSDKKSFGAGDEVLGDAKKNLAQAQRLLRERADSTAKIIKGEKEFSKLLPSQQKAVRKDLEGLERAVAEARTSYKAVNEAAKLVGDEKTAKELNKAYKEGMESVRSLEESNKKLKKVTDANVAIKEQENKETKKRRDELSAYREKGTREKSAQTRIQNLGKAEVAAYAERDRRADATQKRIQDLGKSEVAAYAEEERRNVIRQKRIQDMGKAEVAAYAERDKRAIASQRRIQDMGKAEVAAYAEGERRSNAQQQRIRNLGKAEIAAYKEEDSRQKSRQQRIRIIGKAELAAYSERDKRAATAQKRVQDLGKAEGAAYAERDKRAKLEQTRIRNLAKAELAAYAEVGRRRESIDKAQAQRRSERTDVNLKKQVAQDVFDRYGAAGFKDLDVRAVRREDLGALQKYALAEQNAAKQILLRAQAQKKAQSTISALSKDLQKHTNVVRQLEARYRSLHSPLAQVNLLFRQFFRFAIGYGVLYQALGAVKALVAGVVDLDEQLHSIQAITAASTKEMQGLETTIKRVATSTKFSTNEIAAATRILGQAGVTSPELPEALRATANFAAATASSLEIAADLITTTRNIFKDLDDNTLADQLTKAINISKLTAADLKTILSISAQTAASYNLSSEQYLAAATTLRNAGIKASTVATGLRQGLLEIFSPTTKTIKAIRERYRQLGDEVTEEVVRQRFFGFTKAENPLLAVLAELKRLGFADEAQKEFQRAFNVRASNAIKALVKNYDELAESESKITFGISAAEAADIQMQSLSNSLKNLGAAFTVLGDQILGGAVGSLETFTDKITESITALSDLDIKLKAKGKRGLGAALIPALLGGTAGALAGRSVKGKLFGAAAGTASGAAAGVGEGGVSAAGTAGLLGVLGLLGGPSLVGGVKSAAATGKKFGRLGKVAESGHKIVGAGATANFLAKFGLGRVILAAIPAIGPIVSAILTVGSLFFAFSGLLSEARSPAEAAASKAEAARAELEKTSSELDKLQQFADEFDIEKAEKGDTKGKAANAIVEFEKSFNRANEAIDKVFGRLSDEKRAELERHLKEYARSGTARRGAIGQKIRELTDIRLDGPEFDRILFGIGSSLQGVTDSGKAFMTEFATLFIKAQEVIAEAVSSGGDLDDPEFQHALEILRVFNSTEEYQLLLRGQLDALGENTIKIYKRLSNDISAIDQVQIEALTEVKREQQKAAIRSNLKSAIENATANNNLQIASLITSISTAGALVGEEARVHLETVLEILNEELTKIENDFEHYQNTLRNLSPVTRSGQKRQAGLRSGVEAGVGISPALQQGISDTEQELKDLSSRNSSDIAERVAADKAVLTDAATKLSTSAGQTEARARISSIGGELSEIIEEILSSPEKALEILNEEFEGDLKNDSYKIDPKGVVRFSKSAGSLKAVVEFLSAMTDSVNNTLAGEREYARLIGELPDVNDIIQVDALEREIKRITSVNKDERSSLLDPGNPNNLLNIVGEAKKRIQERIIEGIQNDIFDLGGDSTKIGKLDKAGVQRLIDLQTKLAKAQADLIDIDPATLAEIKKIADDVEKDRIKKAKVVARLGIQVANRWIELAGTTTDVGLFNKAVKKVNEHRDALKREIENELIFEGFEEGTAEFEAEIRERQFLLRDFRSNSKEFGEALNELTSSLRKQAALLKSKPITLGVENDAYSASQGTEGSERRQQSAVNQFGASFNLRTEAETQLRLEQANKHNQAGQDLAATELRIQGLNQQIEKFDQEMAILGITILENSEVAEDRANAELLQLLRVQTLTELLEDSNFAFRNLAETLNTTFVEAIEGIGDAVATAILDGENFADLLANLFNDIGRKMATEGIQTVVNELSTSALGALPAGMTNLLGTGSEAAAKTAVDGATSAATATAQGAAVATAVTASLVPATLGMQAANTNMFAAGTALSLSAGALTTAAGVLGAAAGAEAGGGVLKGVVGAVTASKVGGVFNKHGVDRFGRGGVISGKGTGTSDSIPGIHLNGKKSGLIAVSNGESILTAKATDFLGADFIHAMNSGKIKGFASGAVMNSREVLASAAPAAANASAAPSVTNKNETTIVNAIDSSSVLAAAMETPAGNRVMMNYMRANKSKIQRVIQ